MKKKKFRILVTKKGFATYYSPQVKTWCGWRDFIAFIGIGSIVMGNDFTTNDIRDANDQIDAYCKLMGIKDEDCEIIKES